MGKWFNRLKDIGQKKVDKKELEEQRVVTNLLVTFGNSQEFQEFLRIVNYDKENLEAMEGDAREKGNDRISDIVYGQIKQCKKYLKLIKDCEENLNMLNNSIEQNQSEVKNG